MSPQSQAANPENWIFRALKQNPEGLLLLAAGCALLVRQGVSSSQPGSVRSPPRTNDFAQVTEGARQFATDVAEQTRETASSYAASASEYAGHARRAVEEQSGRIVQQTQSTLQGTMDRVLQEQPLVVALAGLAAGCAVAAAFPATDIERQTLGPVGDQVTKAAKEVGRQLNEATAKAGEQLKASTEERGLSPEGLKEVAKEVAGAFSGSMSGEMHQAAPSGSTESNRAG